MIPWLTLAHIVLMVQTNLVRDFYRNTMLREDIYNHTCSSCRGRWNTYLLVPTFHALIVIPSQDALLYITTEMAYQIFVTHLQHTVGISNSRKTLTVILS